MKINKSAIVIIRLQLLMLLLLVSTDTWCQNVKIEMSSAQRSQIKKGYGMFIHFGINTFNEIEWSNGKLPVSSYNPTNLDCDQWVKIAKEAGFRYVILVTKHHDGFCLWDSKFTDYDVAASPVKVDVVGEVAKACKKYGIKLGLYYSLWDRHEPSYKINADYSKYMTNQLTELMTNYGAICELWFDGAWDKKGYDWNLQQINNDVKKLQPNCMITVNHSIGKPTNPNLTQLPENYAEGDPIRYFPIDFRIKDPNLARWDDPKYYARNGKLYYLPFEHTICLSDRWNWFQKKNVLAPRPLDELEELFYWGTANDNIMIINVPPDLSGNIRTNEKNRILELADRLNIRGGKKPLPKAPVNVTFKQKINASSETASNPASNANDYSLESFWTANDSIANLEITFDKPEVFNRISVFENAELKDLGDKFSKIRVFKIKEFELQSFNNGQWDTFYKGDMIGACKIIRLPNTITTDKIRLVINQANGNPSICHFAVSNTSSKGVR
jgi:alpha-L-fucosidase